MTRTPVASLPWEAIEDPTRAQQQAVADAILAEIRTLHEGLAQHGHKGISRRVRAQRRALAAR